jgi:tRNA (guanine-N7-)-methyltransferase
LNETVPKPKKTPKAELVFGMQGVGGGFFGRRSGKALKHEVLAERDVVLNQLILDLSQPAPAQLFEIFSAPVTRLHLEIGFGGGEHLSQAVRDNPGTGFIGVEPFINGMAKLCGALLAQSADQPNETPKLPGTIRLYDDDAVRLLDWLPEASLDGIDLFYPDPWPKPKHWKRRFVNAGNLNRFARVLKPGGIFRFASDIEHYVNWTLKACDVHPHFEWLANGPSDWHTPHQGWVETRYEAKAKREGRRPCYLKFVRVASRSFNAAYSAPVTYNSK